MPTFAINSVLPSGLAFATTSVPITPPAPPRFSTTTDCPHFCESFAATVRAVISVPPPGANGTMNVTGLAGYGCASAAEKNRDRPHFPLLSAARRKMGSVPVFKELVALRILFVVRLEHGGAARVERKPQRLRRPGDAIGGELQRLVPHAPVRLLAGRLLDQAAAREDQALHIAIAADVVGEAAPGVAGERLSEPLVLRSGLGLGFREAQLARALRVRLSTQVGLGEHDAQLLAVEPTRQVEQAEAVARGAAQASGLDARLHLQAAAAIARERAADPALRILSQREHHGAPGSVPRSVGAGIVLRERRTADEQSGEQASGAQHRSLPMQFLHATRCTALRLRHTSRLTIEAPSPRLRPSARLSPTSLRR